MFISFREKIEKKINSKLFVSYFADNLEKKCIKISFLFI